MVRRIEVPGGFHHVNAVGAGGAALFHDERDFRRFLHYLGLAVDRCGWLCHAYCLMTTHFHLLLETPEPNLGKGMLLLNGSYARYVNWRHKRDGHVFSGPYFVEPVERDAHLLETCRYIVRNPVRAGMVEHPGDWPWSSYRGTGALERRPDFLTVDFVRELFGSPTGYRDFCNQVAEQPGCLETPLQSRAV